MIVNSVDLRTDNRQVLLVLKSNTRNESMKRIYPVVIIGAGPAGIGTAALLSECAIPALVIERGRIGESMRRWPQETRFISPSFTCLLYTSDAADD